MKYVSATDIGLVREENQDMVKVEEFYGNLLAVVCDGMGGELQKLRNGDYLRSGLYRQ